MPPKDWIIYIDPKGKTQACVIIRRLNKSDSDNEFTQRLYLEAEGNKVIGLCSSGTEVDAREYGDTVLRKD
jgi:hypothetical protein